MDLHEQLKEIKTQLRLSMNGVVSQSMREKGLVYKLNFGVELPRIKAIAEGYEKEHSLAQALWKARLLMKKGDMNERTANEFLDQAVCAFISGSYHVRNAAMAAIRRFMQHSEEHAFQVCRRVEEMEHSESEAEQLLYNLVREEIE